MSGIIKTLRSISDNKTNLQVGGKPDDEREVIFETMNNTKNVITKNGLLKWLMKTILVLGLITFSGHVSEARLHNSESTKTELSEVRRISSKKTVYFKTVFSGLNSSRLHLTVQAEKFTTSLLHQDNWINVKLKSNFKAQPPKELVMGYILYYSTESSEEFDTNQLRG